MKFSLLFFIMGKFGGGLPGPTGELDWAVSATVGFLTYDNLIMRNTLYTLFFDR